MEIVKFTKITLDDYINLKHKGQFYLLIDFEDFDKISKYISKKNKFTQTYNKNDIIKWHPRIPGNKIFISVRNSTGRVGWDKIKILENYDYIKDLLFYELANDDKNNGKQILRFYNGDEII